jgi:membrane protease YdiL (CAAX protease family)
MDFTTIAKWWMEIRRIESATVMVENRGVGYSCAAIPLLGSELVVEPIAHRIWPEPEHVSNVIESGASGWRQALAGLLIVWTFASFGEELSYRGYLLTRAADMFGKSNLAYWVAMIVVSLLFGFGHYYKGPSGVLDSTYSGFVLGAFFYYLAAIFGLRS